MKIFYPVVAINNVKLKKLLECKKPTRELHLIVYQLCHLVASRFRKIDIDDAASDCYIKIMGKLDYVLKCDTGNYKAYIESIAWKMCIDMVRKKDNRKRIDDKIKLSAWEIIERQARYGG